MTMQALLVWLMESIAAARALELVTIREAGDAAKTKACNTTTQLEPHLRYIPSLHTLCQDITQSKEKTEAALLPNTHTHSFSYKLHELL